jgi:hypothetical protein
VRPQTVPELLAAPLPLEQTIDQFPETRWFGTALTCALIRIGLLTDPLASRVAKSPEIRHEPMRIVRFRRIAWLAEAGTANAKMEPTQVISAIAPTSLIISPPPTEPSPTVMLRPGTESAKGTELYRRATFP